MNQTTNAAPTLLSIAPAKPAPKAGIEEGYAEGFAEELSSAASRAETPKEPSKKADSSSEQDDADQGDSVPTTDETAPAAEVAESDDTGQQPVEGTVDIGDENGLLAVAIVSETLVVETPPNAQLPEVAATQIDVSIDSQPTEQSHATPTPQGGLNAELALEVTPGVTDSEAAEGDPDTEGQKPSLPVIDDADDANTGDQKTTKATVEAVTGASPTQQSTTSQAGGQDAQPTAATAAATAQAAEAIEVESETESKPGTRLAQQAKLPEPTAEPAPEAQAESTITARETSTPQTINAATTERATGIAKPATRPADALPPIDPARFVSRVARAFDLAQERGGGPIEIRLSPPELGSLQVKIELKEGVLSAALEAETPAARQILLDNLPALRDRLEQQQIRIDKFDVDVRDDSQQRGGDWQPNGEAREQGDERNERREPTPDTPTPTDPLAERPADQTVSTIDFGSDEINLVA